MSLFSLIAMGAFVLMVLFFIHRQKQREAASPYFGCDKGGRPWQSGTGSYHSTADGGGQSCGHGGGDGGSCGSG